MSASGALADRLRHVRWLGGGSGAGKTAIARLLAADYGLRVYQCDETLAAHARRADPARAPLLQTFLAMDMDERWARRTPSVMLQTFPWYQGEGFDLIVEDLLALPGAPPVIVEGFRLLPRLVAPLLSQARQAVWLLPTPEFRRAAFDLRGSTWDIPNRTSQPERALANLLARDALFTDGLASETAALGLETIVITGAEGPAVVARRAAVSLGLGAR